MPKIAIRTAVVLLFGPPGSGKGTVAKHIQGCFDLPHVSTGDILREHVRTGDEIGRQVRSLMESGRLVPDELVDRLVEERLGRPDCSNGLILDGYPRTVAQAQVLSRMLKERGLEPVVVHLNVDYNRIVARLTARRSCPACGAVYNVLSKPPKVEGLCDVDGYALVTRDDDREEVIAQRIAAYERETRPLLDYFSRSVERIFLVDGNEGSPEEIAERACVLISGG